MPSSARHADKYLTGCDSQTTVLLGYGGNDCDYDWQAISDAPSADHSPKTAPDAYIEGMRRAIRKAQDAGAMVAVASLVPLDADRYLQFISKNRDGKNILSWLGDAARLYRWQEYYNALTVQMARAFGCRLVDLRTAFLQSRNFLDLLCPDGIHPTDSGYALAHKTLSAAAAIWEVQFTGQRLHQLAAAQIEFCHQAAVRGVEARMDDGAVGLAGAAADVLLALEHEEAALTAAEIPGDGAARHARADNDHIIHKITSK